MKTRIKVGVSVVFIYAILILFTIYMINRVERLNIYSDTRDNFSIRFEK